MTGEGEGKEGTLQPFFSNFRAITRLETPVTQATGFSSEKTFGNTFFLGRLLIRFLLFHVTKKVSYNLSSVMLTENIEIRLRWDSSWEFLAGVCRPGSPNSDPISDHECNFLHPLSDQTSKIC